jgi:5-methylcytosine-specific restriction protein A
MANSIPEEISKDHVLEAIKRLNAGYEHQFAESTGYDLLFEGKRYPPKAVVGIASEIVTGRSFSPYDFKGGLESKCFRLLGDLGFEIVPKIVSDDSDQMRNWSREELKASVLAYLDLQRRMRLKEHVTKSSVYKNLASKFGRTPKSIEYRMQNISYVLSLHGRHWIDGLLPAKNVGTNVVAEIESILAVIEKRDVVPAIEFEAAVENQLKRKKILPPQGVSEPKRITNSTTSFERNPLVKAWVLRNAGGICESCQQPAPFRTISGEAFLEVHHIRPLADGGSDSIENAVGVCPNCHRGFHYSSERESMSEGLFSRITRLVRE